ncbi:MAG TPA: heme lyase CcmF/NrfE family subunit [Caulobacteraceae bacterium]|nr:heme lyase CcmF/NrfE family subunit [Caulobacteraceae bacterium]
MIAEFGAFALMLALALSAAQAALSAAGRWRLSPALQGAGEGAALGAFLGVLIAFLALMDGFVRSDFSLANVASNSTTDEALFYKVTGVWGSHEGSVLLWNLVLTGFGALVVLFGDNLPRNLKALTVMTQGVLGVLFIGYTVLASSPFARLASPPTEGNPLNPILQDPTFAIHPPFLYCGYVGFSVVFSLAVAALIEGKVDAAWARWVRPWTLAAWSFLTVGITLGSFWSYYTQGWGGWWFWDPVENASFMPWLAGAALLHSAIVTERRGALVGWTVFLALIAFTLSMLGTFLVRSGVLTSVHAFAVDPTRGTILLGIVMASACAAFSLFAWRAAKLTGGGLFAPVSREGALVLNNLFLSTACATVLLGTLFPLIRQALTPNDPVSVGPPFYALTFTPLMAITLLLVPFGPLLAWKRGDALAAAQTLWVAAALSVAGAIVALALVRPLQALSCAGLALGLWLIFGALAELAERVRLLRAPGDETLRRLGGLPRGAWGATLAHAGLGVFVLGACFESSWKLDNAQALSVGQSMTIGAYTLRLDRVSPVDGHGYAADHAVISAFQSGRPICTLEPERRTYPLAGGQTTTRKSICVRGVSDLYVGLDDALPSAGPGGVQAWVVRAYWYPWARLIFIGPILMAIGGLISLSDRRLRFSMPQKAKARADALAAEAAE